MTTTPLRESNRVAFVLMALVTLFGASGCAPDRRMVRETQAIADAARSTELSCHAADRCALHSPFAPLIAETRQRDADGGPRHVVGLLERGEESLALRVHLIRAARRTIDIQTFIFSEDNAGYLVFNELLAAARRGVKVRVLTDQLFSLDNTALLAQLARAHVNFELRVYNPVFHKARTQPLEFAAGIVCCFMSFNQRMHNKTMVVDDAIGITGGRNVDDRYFDWSDSFNYRDRDVWVVGPAAREMTESFEDYWAHETAVPLAALRDVSQRIAKGEPGAIAKAPPDATRAERVEVVRMQAEDGAWVQRTFIDGAFHVGRAEYFADLPDKSGSQRYDQDLSHRIGTLIGSAETSIVLQTPYLVISKGAREQLQAQRVAHPDLRIVVSTNSLASTDAFYVYAISHKYKRRYLKKLHFEIHEYKPFPGRGVPEVRPLSLSGVTDPPAGSGSGWGSSADDRDARSVRRSVSGSTAGTGSIAGSRGDASRTRRDDEQRSGALRAFRHREPAPLTRPGVRRGMHAKSIVIDHEVAMIGSHNFDPRSDKLNTEAGLIIFDAGVSRALEEQIRIDLAPENAWVIARRERLPVVGGVNGTIERISETLPFFDLWPIRYATSFELKPECEPMSPFATGFHDCYVPVGDFPEVSLSLKDIYTRLITAFGVGLTPIL
jgi:putative cardiolipin synthase